ncbi:hypothetical protein RIF29_14077 [Crotalaria pallida]|uniref:Uncharacterized protein n=1 Tax=Crotalaria pallida TaxID=3830 RepID=A0AAN9FET8_CROPI
MSQIGGELGFVEAESEGELGFIEIESGGELGTRVRRGRHWLKLKLESIRGEPSPSSSPPVGVSSSIEKTLCTYAFANSYYDFDSRFLSPMQANSSLEQGISDNTSPPTHATSCPPPATRPSASGTFPPTP